MNGRRRREEEMGKLRIIFVTVVGLLLPVFCFGAQTADVTVTVTVRVISLTVVGSSSYDFGLVPEGSSVVASNSIEVQNDGNDTEDFSLQITSYPSGVWSVKETSGDPGADEFKLYALYDSNGQVPDGDTLDASDYDENDLILASSARNATDGYFDSGDESADEVPSGQSRHLWFMFKSPNPSSDYTQQSITVTVSASVD